MPYREAAGTAQQTEYTVNVESALLMFCNELARLGEAPSVIVLGPTAYNKLLNELSNRVSFNSSNENQSLTMATICGPVVIERKRP